MSRRKRYAEGFGLWFEAATGGPGACPPQIGRDDCIGAHSSQNEGELS